jgi:uncharacterized protein (TIGR02246 family)
MRLSTFRHGAILAGAAALSACAERPAADDTAQDAAEIRALIDKIERTFSAGDLDEAMSVFAPDAAIIAPGTPDLVGTQAIRPIYAAMMDQVRIETELTTAELEIAGDLAYERGTYTLKLVDKATGQVVSDVVNRHLHIFRRQPDGEWKTWRMMVNSADPPPMPAAAAQ